MFGLLTNDGSGRAVGRHERDALERMPFPARIAHRLHSSRLLHNQSLSEKRKVWEDMI